MRRRALWFAGLMAGVCLMVAAPGQAKELKVVASIKPIHSLVAGVMQGIGAPVLLVSGAGSPHGYSLRPSEARALHDADLVFWVGERLETFLLKPLGTLAPAAAVVELADADGVMLLPSREGGVWDPPVDDAEPAADPTAGPPHGRDRAGAHDLARGGTDMHIWLDPRNAMAMVSAIEAALSAADSDHAAAYRDNGARLQTALAQLDQTLARKLTPFGERAFVVFHDGYQYFERRYRLNAAGAITVDPERRPGAQRLREIHAKLIELSAACVFAEPQFEPALVDTVLEDTGAKKGVLDPLGVELEAGPEHYFQLMNRLADSLADCLGARKSG